MTSEARISLAVGFLIVLALGVGAQFPALISARVSPAAGLSEEAFQKIVQGEVDHCQSNVENVNCRCFGDISGMIIAEQSPRVPFSTYADQHALARGQAKSKC